MKMKLFTLMAASLIAVGCCKQAPASLSGSETANITAQSVVDIQKKLIEKHGDAWREEIIRGVAHAASLWRSGDGDTEEFTNFCFDNFIANHDDKKVFFEKVSRNFEILYGHYNTIMVDLQRPIHEPMGTVTAIDEAFAAYSPQAHLSDDLYGSKIAFQIAINFPYYTLNEKQELSSEWSRLQWAYARLGDMFESRIPAKVLQDIGKAESEAEIYISGYNIHAGKLVNDQNESLFPDDMVLLSHWNIRDEIKSNYSQRDVGLRKQETLYSVMLHIVNQTIPLQVINNPELKWNPFSNDVYRVDTKEVVKPENDHRYQMILNCFNAMRQADAYSPLHTAVERAFEGQMEIAQTDAEKLFVDFLSNPVLKDVGKLISKRLGRELKPWDIWYDGFKPRSGINEEELDRITASRYPNAAAMKNDLSNLLVKLGFASDKANYIADKIEVEPARGSGHAWGAAMKGDKAHLRTRIGAKGMDYKGYNIAIHEFGHNVEQTISLYDVDYYMLQGVPNTAFTEALAFLFQKRDLDLLGIHSHDPQKQALDVLDNIWATYEIMGVSLLDQYTWQWMYANPNATATELKHAVTAMASDIWNKYYAPVFGVGDTPILAIYSHMVNSPIYLSNYAFGHLIQFQVEQFLQKSQFAPEVLRIFALGKLTPSAWMQQGVGEPISTDAMIGETQKALKIVE